jgi:hypothetical protein
MSAAAPALKVHVHPDLASCVGALQTTAPALDIAAVVAALDAPLRAELAPEAAKRDLALAEIAESSASAFVTERVDILAIKYDVVYSGLDTSSERSPRTQVSIQASGNARFDMRSHSASDVQLGRVEFRYVDDDGVHRNANVYLANGSATLGEQLVTYSLEHPI